MADHPDAGQWRQFTRAERAMSARMQRVASVPVATEFVTATVDASLDRVANLRSDGAPVTFNTMLMWAVRAGLAAVPAVAAHADYEQSRMHVPDTADVGVAVATENGLLVPVLRGIDRMTFDELARALHEVVAAARAGERRRDLYTGAHFTVTNIGMAGVEGGLPLLQVPQVAVLGVGAVRAVPAVRDGEIVIARQLILTIGMDHRVLDGMTAARFLDVVRAALETPDTPVPAGAGTATTSN